MLDPELLAAERQRFYVQTRGGVYFPISGAIFWTALGIAGFYLSARTWCVLVLSMGVLATPIAILFFRNLVAKLALKSPLATLILPALLPVALCLGMAIAAFQTDLSLVPLALVIGMASHWSAVGWMYGTRIYSMHAVVRVVLAVAIWFMWPEARFTALPIAIGVIYALTSFWLLHEVRQLERLRALP